MTHKRSKSPLLIASGIAMFAIIMITSCNNNSADNKNSGQDTITTQPADMPAVPDTLNMDSATTRPVKAGN